MRKLFIFCALAMLAGGLVGCDNAAVDKPAPTTNAPPPDAKDGQMTEEAKPQEEDLPAK